MTLVTEQGRAARAEWLAAAEALTPQLLTALTDGPVTPKQLLRHFPATNERLLREAMWTLIDRRHVRIRHDRRIELV